MPSGYIDDPTTISKEEAWEAIEEKIRATGAGGGKGGKGTAGAKGKSKTATTKKKAAAGVPQGPPPPKRPQSAYLLFCADNRADVSKTTKKLGDISKELARRWKEQGDRGVWERKAEELKKGYEIKKSKWEEENGGGKKGGAKGRGAKGKTKSGGVKVGKSPSAYMIYCKEKRQSVMEMKGDDGKKLKFGEVTQVLAKGWKSLREEERGYFEDKAKAAKKAMEATGDGMEI